MTSSKYPEPTRTHGLLINRNFGLLWAGQSISFIGDALLDFTLALWIVFDLGRGQVWAPLAVGGVMVASSVGTLIIGPIAGVFVDRWDKRRSLLWVIAVQAILTASLLAFADLAPLPFFAGGRPALDVKLVALYTVIFVVYGCAQLVRAARTALIGDLVAEGERPQASGLLETMSSLSFIIGFGVAPLLFVPFGISIALIADALSFVVAFVSILGITAPPAAHSVARGERGSVGREFLDGLRFSLGNLVIRTLLLVFTIVLFGSGAINALFIFFLTDDLHAPQAAIGLFPVALGAGLVVGSILGGAIAGRVGLTRLLWISVVLTGVCAIALSRQTSLIPGLVCGCLLGVPNGVMNVVLMPLVLAVTPRVMVGRVMTVLEPAMMAAQVTSVAFFGALASTLFSGFHANLLGLRFDTYDLLILIPGVLCVVAGGIAFVSLRRADIARDGVAES
ncbi:MAG: MFS transporter [Ktedonobacterales bacterium]